MSSNIIGPLPKKSDAPSEKVKKSIGYFDDIENPLVTTIDIVDKKVKSKLNVVEEANTCPISSKNKTEKFNKTEKPQALKKQSLLPKKINPTHLTH